METNREVKALLTAEKVDMEGFEVYQAFPTNNIESVDPFLLLHHGIMKVDEYTEARHGGVGPHPHRGFSPVTFIYRGGVHHRDSRGNNSTIYAGGVQWMDAGMGVIHSERPVADVYAKGEETEIIQLWINTPAAHKMDIPRYYAHSSSGIPIAYSADNKVMLQVIAGQLLQVKGPIQHITPVNAATINMQAGGYIQIPLPAGHNAFIYLLAGKIMLQGYGVVEQKQAAVFKLGEGNVAFNVLEEGKALLMTGEPLNEPVVAQGPFVMNTHTQILEAMRDYQMGKMGFLVEE